jgi:hypothetical protein
LLFNGLLSHIPDGEKPFEIAQDYFLGLGVETDLIGNNVAIIMGYRVFGYNGIMDDNMLCTKLIFSVTPKIKDFSGPFTTLLISLRISQALIF